MKPAHVIITDFGTRPVMRGNFDQLLADNLRQCSGNVELAVHRTIRLLPSFAKAYFVVGGKYLVAESKSVYLGKNGEGAVDPVKGSTIIHTVSLEPERDRVVILGLTLYVRLYTNGCTELLEVGDEVFNGIVRRL